MDQQNISLLQLPTNKKARITSIIGGHGFQRKLQVLGIRKGQEITIVSKQPFTGPLTISVGRCKMTIGRGMAQKIMVEIL